VFANTTLQALATVVCSHGSHHPRLASPPVTAVDSDPRVPLPRSHVSERITWIAPKGRPGDNGRLCVDPSTILDNEGDAAGTPDDGAANAQLPRTGAEDKEDENPPVYYGTAFLRFLIWIYNLRVDHPAEVICLSADNITAALHRILYHPDMAILWATVFQESLVIPCGMIFGGRNSPSFYMIPGELRAHVASASDFGPITTDLSESIVLATPPSPRAALQLARATPDDKNPGAALLLNDPTRRYAHSSFVDDTGNAHIRSRIVGAITNSILSAYVVFGFPSEDRRAPCFNPFKWTPQVGFTLRFLASS
jgi:hypothetical protein